jgi:hypothetical protein
LTGSASGERVPDPVQTTGVSFHYEEPGSRAPQALLVTVCPDKRPVWDDNLGRSWHGGSHSRPGAC